MKVVKSMRDLTKHSIKMTALLMHTFSLIKQIILGI